MNARSFFNELKRRNVYKVAVAYGVVGWLLIQVATQVFPFLEIPNWTIRLVILLTALGFPVALVIAWAFELTPEGIKRTETADAAGHHSRGGIWIAVVVVAAMLSLGIFILGRYTADHGTSQVRQVTTATPDKSIAVLPFENLSGDPSNAYFADGVQEEILNRLSKIADLKVISRTSTQRYRSAPNNLAEISKQLGVANILEGTIQKSADRVRVNVQLINAATDSHIWADRFDRKLTDIFAVESDIAAKIADTLQAKLTGSERHALASRPTENTEAHQLYLKGRYYWNQRSEQGLKKAIEYFQQAIDADPNYALAYAGVADAYALLGFHGYGVMTPSNAFPKARAAAEKALQIDDTLGEAHASLAYVKEQYEWDMPGAEREYERALELNPNYATAHQWYALYLPLLGRYPEAILEVKKAQELDPLSRIINVNVGWALYFARQYDEALRQCWNTLELDPNYSPAHWMLGQVYRQKGMYRQAITEFQKAVDLSAGDPIQKAVLGHAYAVAGERDQALAVINELKEISKQRYFPSYFVALIYVGLNEQDQAFEWLEKAFQERSAGLTFLNAEPMFDPIRGHPRFEALVQRVFAKQ